MSSIIIKVNLKFLWCMEEYLCSLEWSWRIRFLGFLSSICFSYFTLCWMLFGPRLSSICFINLVLGAKKKVREERFQRQLHLHHFCFCFAQKSAVLKKKRLHTASFFWSQAFTGGFQVLDSTKSTKKYQHLKWPARWSAEIIPCLLLNWQNTQFLDASKRIWTFYQFFSSSPCKISIICPIHFFSSVN